MGRVFPWALGVAGVVFVGQAGAQTEKQAQKAPAAAAAPVSVDVVNAKGARIGTLTMRETPNGVLMQGDLSGLPPGDHAVHVHEAGRCEPPFETAGGHFNPESRQHGFLDRHGAHAGDLPNIHVSADGRARFEHRATGFVLGAGKTSLFDADGSSIVIHAKADDHDTEPAGGSGDRIACGVIAAPGTKRPAK